MKGLLILFFGICYTYPHCTREILQPNSRLATRRDVTRDVTLLADYVFSVQIPLANGYPSVLSQHSGSVLRYWPRGPGSSDGQGFGKFFMKNILKYLSYFIFFQFLYKIYLKHSHQSRRGRSSNYINKQQFFYLNSFIFC